MRESPIPAVPPGFWLTIGLGLVVAFLAACAAPAPPSEQTPHVQVTVDADLTPPTTTLPAFEDGRPRPVAAVTDVDGNVAMFVEDELWIAPDDPGQLAELLDRVGGEVVLAIDPDEHELEDLGPQFLVRLDGDAIDTASFGALVRELEAEVTGTYSVSSQAALGLLTAAAEVAVEGRVAGVNWVGQGGGFRGRDVEAAPVGPAGVDDYSPNPFSWPSHALDATQGIGVAEAWRALDFAGLLERRIGVAILDMGFSVDADTPPFLAVSNVPASTPLDRENLIGCGSGNPCPWHGANAVSAAMAIPDNAFGSAGPAGPVAQALMVFTLYDFFTSISALAQARVLGARIANMSYGAPVPDFLAWSVAPFNEATRAVRRSGMLLFAAAGNDGEDVNRERCVGAFGVSVCWERRFHTPCQNAGVICVGGLRHDSVARHPNSNFGDSVDIWAPFELWLGPDPDHPDNATRTVRGTSFSSPFVAGVAALIWAADPSASRGTIEARLFDAARESPRFDVSSIVHAYDAVLAGLGNVPPAVTITNPEAGGEVDLNRSVSLRAATVDVEDGEGCCVVRWSSDVDGPLGTTTGPTHTLHHAFDTLGARVITAEAEDEGGATARDSVSVEVVNTPPSVEIIRPTTGEELPAGVDVILRGTAHDPNEPGLSLACDRLSWSSDHADDPLPVSGCDVLVTFTELGERTITLTGTDPQGASDATSVTVEVVPPPDALPPTVQIVEPAAGSFPFGQDEPIDLVGNVTDPGGATELEIAWTASYTQVGDDFETVAIGSELSFTWVPSDDIPFTDPCAGAHIRLRLEATNPAGATGSDEVAIDVLVIC